MGLNILTLGASKKYTEKTIVGAGALKGQDGKDGIDGISPIIIENENNNDTVYKLDITDKNGTFTTPNLMGQGGSDGSGDENVIESISVNGTALTPDTNKNVDITIPKAYDDTTLSDRVTANEEAIATLNGTGKGSVSKTVNDVLNKFATDLSNDGVVNTYKELVDYAASHSSEVTEMVADIADNTTVINELDTRVSELETSVENVYTKDETYSRTEVDDLISNAQLSGEEVDFSEVSKATLLETVTSTIAKGTYVSTSGFIDEGRNALYTDICTQIGLDVSNGYGVLTINATEGFANVTYTLTHTDGVYRITYGNGILGNWQILNSHTKYEQITIDTDNSVITIGQVTVDICDMGSVINLNIGGSFETVGSTKVTLSVAHNTINSTNYGTGQNIFWVWDGNDATAPSIGSFVLTSTGFNLTLNNSQESAIRIMGVVTAYKK